MDIMFIAMCPHREEEIEYEISIDEDSFCEHCYNIGPYEIIVSDGAGYCLGCRDVNNLKIPEADLALAEKISKKRKKAYYKKKLKELE